MYLDSIQYNKLYGGIVILQQGQSLMQMHSQIQKQKKEMLTAHLCIPSRISLIDEFIGGFKESALTYLYGDSSLMYHFPYYLCVNTYTMFRGISVFIDGGTSMNPYILSHYAKTYEISAFDLLQCVHVSRAFTLHQLHSLVHDELEHLIQQQKLRTIIFHAFSLLYADREVSFHESSTLFNVALEKIHSLTKKYDLIALITNPIHQRTYKEYILHQLLFNECDESISIQQMKHCPRVWLPQYHCGTTLTRGIHGQLCLQDFGMVL
jgi:hypothetical protein